MSGRDIRLIMLVALSDVDEPFVVGAWEEGILDTMGADEVERVFRETKEAWYPDGTEWREIRVDVPSADLLAAFVSPVVGATVVPEVSA